MPVTAAPPLNRHRLYGGPAAPAASAPTPVPRAVARPATGGSAGAGGNGANGGDGGDGGDGGSGGRSALTAPTAPAAWAGPARSLAAGTPGGKAEPQPLAKRSRRADVEGRFEPVVYVSVNGGPLAPVLVDTGSTGLVMEDQYVPNPGSSVATGSVTYSGPGSSVTVNYTASDETVGFLTGANGSVIAVTAPTAVDVLTGSNATNFANFWAGSGVVGVLGIGPNDGFPGTSTVITALPGTLDQGVLFNQPQNQVVFGPNPLPGTVSITGSPTVSNVDVQVTPPGHTTTSMVVPSVIIDSGDNFGSIPASLLGTGQTSGTVPVGTVISVQTSTGQLLYTYTTTATNPLTVTGSVMNTGNIPFELGPVYISESPSARDDDLRCLRLLPHQRRHHRIDQVRSGLGEGPRRASANSSAVVTRRAGTPRPSEILTKSIVGRDKPSRSRPWDRERTQPRRVAAPPAGCRRRCCRRARW